MREDRIRDLIHRLAGMSPEPPPFPEETQMARHTDREKLHPALVFLGAAAAVAALAIPVILLTGDEPPVGVASTTTTSTTIPGSSTTAAPSTTVIETTTTTDAGTTTAPVPVPTVWVGTVFLYQSPQNSFMGNPALAPVSLELTDLSAQLLPRDQFTEALTLIGPGFPELPAGSELSNVVPPEVQIIKLTPTGPPASYWVADMNEAFLAGAGGLLADMTMLNQLIYTITYGEGTDAGVLFTVDGEPIDAFGSEGLDLTEPVYRTTFQDGLAPIFLTEPIYEQAFGYQVVGMANVFEASLIVQVIDADGNVTHEEPVMATCGSGCWGEFSTEIDANLITPGESSIRLLTYSAQDGSPTDVITVPIPADDIWQITVGD